MSLGSRQQQPAEPAMARLPSLYPSRATGYGSGARAGTVLYIYDSTHPESSLNVELVPTTSAGRAMEMCARVGALGHMRVGQPLDLEQARPRIALFD